MNADTNATDGAALKHLIASEADIAGTLALVPPVSSTKPEPSSESPQPTKSIIAIEKHDIKNNLVFIILIELKIAICKCKQNHSQSTFLFATLNNLYITAQSANIKIAILIIKENICGIQRYICHPILFTIVGHRKANTMKTWIRSYECR